MNRLIALALIILTTLAFWRLTTNDFVISDDQANIYENPHFEKDSPEGLAVLWEKPFIQLYIPVTYTVWGLLVKFSYLAGWATELADVPPLLFHGINILVHLASVLLVFNILRLLLPNASRFAAGLGSALFAIHPLQVEAVAWATGLKDVLSGALALAALLSYLLSRQPNRTPQSKTRLDAMGLVLFALSLFSKPSSAPLPFLAAILAIGMLGIPLRTTLRSLLPWFCLAIGVIALTRAIQPEHIAGTIPPLWLRPVIAADALLFYARQLLFPYILSPQYGRSPDSLLESFNLARGAILLFATLLTGTGFWLLRKKARPETFRTVVVTVGISFFAFLPVLGFIPFGHQRYSTVADRYAYLPMLGPALLITWLLIKNTNQWILAAASALIIILAVRTNFQVAHWKDSCAYLDNALKLRPDYYILPSIRGILKTEEKRYDEAFAAFTEAHQLEPNDFDITFNLGATRMLQERYEDALPFLQRAQKLSAKNSEVHRHLGDALRNLDRHSEAVDHYRQAIALPDPQSPAYNGLGISLVALEQDAEALEHFKEAARLEPGHPEANYRCGWLLATSTDDNLRNSGQAIWIANDAITSHGKNAKLGDLLAAALAESGRFEEAIQLLDEILANLTQSPSPNQETLDRLQRHRDAYQRHQPWRGPE